MRGPMHHMLPHRCFLRRLKMRSTLSHCHQCNQIMVEHDLHPLFSSTRSSLTTKMNHNRIPSRTSSHASPFVPVLLGMSSARETLLTRQIPRRYFPRSFEDTFDFESLPPAKSNDGGRSSSSLSCDSFVADDQDES
jgi:hypothetical protein